MADFQEVNGRSEIALSIQIESPSPQCYSLWLLLRSLKQTCKSFVQYPSKQPIVAPQEECTVPLLRAIYLLRGQQQNVRQRTNGYHPMSRRCRTKFVRRRSIESSVMYCAAWLSDFQDFSPTVSRISARLVPM